MNALNIIKKPIVSEKSTMARELNNEYVFQVSLAATKPEIREAVEKAFGVKVGSVNTSVVPGRYKKFGRDQGRVKKWKKAVVKLKDGEKIELFEGV
jgi:large subunit ribosomal protein L23